MHYIGSTLEAVPVARDTLAIDWNFAESVSHNTDTSTPDLEDDEQRALQGICKLMMNALDPLTDDFRISFDVLLEAEDAELLDFCTVKAEDAHTANVGSLSHDERRKLIATIALTRDIHTEVDGPTFVSRSLTGWLEIKRPWIMA